MPLPTRIAENPRRLAGTAETPEATAHLGALIAGGLAPGDVVAMTGPLGAGKSHLARAIVRERLEAPNMEVPSPSYTLVNVYEDRVGEIWHADLYRLGATEELPELGLDDAAATAIVLVEWAERWRPAPVRRLEIALCPLGPESRRIEISAIGSGWRRVLGRIERAS